MNRFILCNTVLALLLLSLAACQTENSGSGSGTDINQNQTPTQNVKLKVNETQVSIEADKNLTSKFRIEAENVRWAVTKPSTCDWLTVDPLRGNATTDVNLTATANTDVDHTRMVELGVDAIESTYKFSQNVMVVQKAPTPYISVNQNSCSFSGQSGSVTITLDSNVDWEVYCNDDWLHPAKYTNEILKINVDKNPGQQRTGNIMLRRKGTETVLNNVAVVQGELNVTSTTEKLVFSPNDYGQSFSFTAEDAWEASIGGASWLSVSPITGVKGTYTMRVVPLQNEARADRNAFVYIEMKDVNKKLEIPVTQRGVTSEKSHEKLTFGSVQSTGDISYKSNVNWTASSSSEFITVSPMRGSANEETTITVTVDANTTAEDREGKIYFKPSFGPSDSIVVTQHKRMLETDKSSILFTKDGGEMNVEVTAESSWTASTSVSWVRLSTTSGTGNGTIKVTAEPNAKHEERNAVIYLVSGAVKKEVNVSQTAREIQGEVTPSKMSFADMGGTQTLNINTNTSWTASTSEDWLSLSVNRGSSSEEIIVTASPNRHIDARTGTIVISFGEITRKVEVTQEGELIKIVCDEVLTNSNAKTVTMTLMSEGDWTASTTDEWLHLDKTSGTGEAEIKVNVDDNASISERTGEITFTNAVATRMYTFKQPGRMLSCNVSNVEMVSAGGISEVITITTDGKYNISTDEEWISVNENSNTFTINVTEMTNQSKREGDVIVTLTDLTDGQTLSVKVHVTQIRQKFVQIGLEGFEEDKEI